MIQQRCLWVVAAALLACMPLCAQSRRSVPAALPFPEFSFDSLRYTLRFPPALQRAGRTGAVRLLVRVSASGKVTVSPAADVNNDKDARAALEAACRRVRFTAPKRAGRRVPSAVAVTAWFLFDNSYNRNIPFIDVALDSSNVSASTFRRDSMVRVNGGNLQPVYSASELAGRLSYPQEIPHHPVADTVTVRVLVERSGTAEHTFVEKSPHPLLGLAAEEAVRGLRFAPAMQLGTPVAIWTDVPVVFAWKREE